MERDDIATEFNLPSKTFTEDNHESISSERDLFTKLMDSDVFELVFEFLDVQDLGFASSVNRRFNEQAWP